MENFSIGEVIEMAVQTERLGYRFYKDMAEKFKTNKDLKKLFDTLADKEKVHEERFSELKGIVGGREPVDWQEARNYFRAIMESEFFIGKGKALPSMGRAKTAEDAVAFALGFEKEGLLFYLGLRREVREKDILDEIINEEQSHIMWLRSFKGSF